MTRPYLAIADYGAIGNLRTVALVGRDGSIDWCCLPHLDSPSVFAAVLDAERGGRFEVSLGDGQLGAQRYIPGTNVLETTFRGPSGRLRVTDFMPVAGNLTLPTSRAWPELHRILEVPEGSVSVVVHWSPRFDYARAGPRIQESSGGVLASAGADRLSLGGMPPDATVVVTEDASGPTVRVEFEMTSPERLVLVSRWQPERLRAAVPESDGLLDETVVAWREWSGGGDEGDRYSSWAGPWSQLVDRSELALKLLVFPGTGAIAAAPTTSLPEWIGGVRNWDYRYTWIRDASMTAQALVALDHAPEAVDFLQWAERVSAVHHEPRALAIMYGLRGETELAEEELEHLEGYRGSAPVRIGNGAAGQRQLDIYGELLDGAYELAMQGQRPEPRMRAFLRDLADAACAALDEEDNGIWEVRGPARHFTYSKLMVWVALDRALALARMGALDGATERWRTTRARASELVLEHGLDRATGAFTQSFGSTVVDAANLRIPLFELLPFDDPRVQRTIDRTLAELTENGLVYRYRADDGLPGREGAFVLCTTWLVDALALSGRLDEALDLFEQLAGRVNHVGLLPEQIEPASGEFLGNFPQAFSHIGLVNSAIYLADAEGRRPPTAAPLGSEQHRRERRSDD